MSFPILLNHSENVVLDWLLVPIDPTRANEVGIALAWHGRLMVVAWGVLVPIAILVARFYKIWPGQNWPSELDNPNWWRIHWITQSLAIALSALALLLVFQSSDAGALSLHEWLGYCVFVLGVLQVGGGVLRGSKGGPTDVQMRGDHFDMTRHRVIFEILHKSMGYQVLVLAILVILIGLWEANAPRWMFLILCMFWCAIAAAFWVLHLKGRAIDTYQAIWGADPGLPGNQIEPIGWGIHRLDYKEDNEDGRHN